MLPGQGVSLKVFQMNELIRSREFVKKPFSRMFRISDIRKLFRPLAKNGREIVDKIGTGFMMISLTLFNGTVMGEEMGNAV